MTRFPLALPRFGAQPPSRCGRCQAAVALGSAPGRFERGDVSLHYMCSISPTARGEAHIMYRKVPSDGVKRIPARGGGEDDPRPSFTQPVTYESTPAPARGPAPALPPPMTRARPVPRGGLHCITVQLGVSSPRHGRAARRGEWGVCAAPRALMVMMMVVVLALVLALVVGGRGAALASSSSSSSPPPPAAAAAAAAGCAADPTEPRPSRR
eukprot:scaffold5321_cov366-Prasinococcus_capsulatus_cf.AAC.2